MIDNRRNKNRDFHPSYIRKILIRVNNWIGDVVMISPAMRSIRHHFREATISILAKTWVVESLKGNPFYDELIEYENLARHRGLWGRWKIIRQLKEKKFDMAILFQKAFEAAFLSYLSRIPLRIGYDTDRRGFLLTHKIHETEESRKKHHVEYFLDIARFLGCQIQDRRLYFHIEDKERQAVSKTLHDLGLVQGKPFVVMHPGTSKEERAWHEKRFSLLADKISKTFGIPVVLTGGKEDEALCRNIHLMVRNQVYNLSGHLSIKELGALFEHCSLFIGNDSGPMHIAAAVGAPIVAIFGPGAPEKTAPFVDASQYKAITRRYPCAPCKQNFFQECPPSPSGKPYCLEDISVEEVFAAVSQMISLP